MQQVLYGYSSDRVRRRKKTVKIVLLSCIACALLIIFVSAENLLWRTTDYYPATPGLEGV